MEESLYDTNQLIDTYKDKETIEGFTTILNLIEFPKINPAKHDDNAQAA